MAAVNIEIQGVAPLQSFQYFLVAKRVLNDAEKKALLLHTVGTEAQELYETLTDPGPMEEFEEDTATDFEKTVRILSPSLMNRMNDMYSGAWLNRREKQLVNS